MKDEIFKTIVIIICNNNNNYIILDFRQNNKS